MRLSAFLFVCTCTYTVTAQGGCNTLSSTNGLIPGTDKTGLFPNLDATPGGTVQCMVYRIGMLKRFLLFQSLDHRLVDDLSHHGHCSVRLKYFNMVCGVRLIV